MFNNELGLPPHEGLPGRPDPPLIDGFVEPEPGVDPPGFEFGYVNSGRFIYGGQSGIPLAVIDCVRDNAQSLMYLGIATRLNVSFNDNDFVMIVLRPGGPSASPVDDLRIHIKPVSSGADGASPAVTMPAQPGDSAVPDVRGNRAPAFSTTFYKRSPLPLTPGARVWTATTQPNSFDVKVRSTKTGSARCWSAELQIPTGGAGSLGALQANFGLYINLGRVFTSGQSQGYIDQMPWPYDPAAATANIITNPGGVFLENWDIPAPTTSSGIGKGILVTSQVTNPAKGVKFVGQEGGIGVLSGTAITQDLNTTVGALNKLVARLANTGTAAAPDIRATFRVANFGINGPNQPGYGANWAKVPQNPPTTNNPTLAVSIPASTAQQDITLNWTISQQDHDNLRIWDHTCMAVDLDSIAPAGQVANIVESSVRRNLVFTGLSEVDHSATVDGRGLGLSRTGDGKHDVLLHVSSIPIPRRQVDPRHDRSQAERFYEETFGSMLAAHVNETPGSKETVGWVSVVNAYVVTDKELTIAGRPHKVVISGGAYGFVSEHILEQGETAANIDVTHALFGAGLVDHGRGLYQLSVPENGTVKLRNRLATIRTDEPTNWFLRLLKWILKWIKDHLT